MKALFLILIFISSSVFSGSPNVSRKGGTAEPEPYVYVEARGNGGQSMTVDVTPIPFIEVLDTDGLWDGDEFTPATKGLYTFSVSAIFVTAAKRSLVLSTATKQHRISDISDDATLSSFTGSITVMLDAGEVASIKSATTGGALNNSSVTHWLTIARIPGKLP